MCGALFCSLAMFAQQKVRTDQPWSVRMAESEMVRCPEAWQIDFVKKPSWGYCHGVVLQACLNIYDTYNDKKFFDYAEEFCDKMIDEEANIISYRPADLNLDRINSGKILFRIYEQTKKAKYKKAMDKLREQLTVQPRTQEGGFWHKLRYPNQMWLDGIYMASPFYAEYSFRNNRVEDYKDVIRQFTTVAKHTYDPQTGLYRHAWDEKCIQKWADPQTGQSAHTWGRAMGWFAMALVDVLEFIPKHEPGRNEVLAILNNVATQIKKWQDKKSGVWYQVIDRSGDKGNYLEATVSTMFVYTLYKAIRLGYIDASYMAVADKGYEGIQKEFIKVGDDGVITITDCCAVAGLGGTPYRSGTYEYYINEQIRENDPKAIGPFINLSLERERLGK